jgi:hypothetical protein
MAIEHRIDRRQFLLTTSQEDKTLRCAQGDRSDVPISWGLI